MYSSSSTMRYPETPSSRNPLQYKPLNSSPLVDSPESPKTSPAAAAQARRKSQYKGHVSTTPLFSRTATAGRGSARRSGSSSTAAVETDPQKSFLRGRLQARCLERASKAREKAVLKTRQASFGPSSDDQAMDDDDGEDDDDIMQDELFRRIVANASRKQTHSYRLSYAQEVGSSFDPDIEDVSSWEAELSAVNSAESRGETIPYASTSGGSSTAFSSWPESEEFEEDFVTPVDLDEEELAEYAEEYYARHEAVADFEDLPEELLGWTGDVDSEPTTPSSIQREIVEDSMDVS
ncbi:hypothetical protein CVT25_011705 [Psilocybe cyanescens]|uniref:Uncharacterized protein n=1 Tax=Psilocybe cyanescens TaxID=93625 RepID=A0A409WI98_PSICY|nr:hypothetical protein CVT25_011705 [Psilocybe cyanescens]